MKHCKRFSKETWATWAWVRCTAFSQKFMKSLWFCLLLIDLLRISSIKSGEKRLNAGCWLKPWGSASRSHEWCQSDRHCQTQHWVSTTSLYNETFPVSTYHTGSTLELTWSGHQLPLLSSSTGLVHYWSPLLPKRISRYTLTLPLVTVANTGKSAI